MLSSTRRFGRGSSFSGAGRGYAQLDVTLPDLVSSRRYVDDNAVVGCRLALFELTDRDAADRRESDEALRGAVGSSSKVDAAWERALRLLIHAHETIVAA